MGKYIIQIISCYLGLGSHPRAWENDMEQLFRPEMNPVEAFYSDDDIGKLALSELCSLGSSIARLLKTVLMIERFFEEVSKAMSLLAEIFS